VVGRADGHRVAQQRLRNQRLSGAALAAPEDVVRWLGAVQAQEYPYARWSLAQRSRRADDLAMERAVAEGRILRTHALELTGSLAASSLPG